MEDIRPFLSQLFQSLPADKIVWLLVIYPSAILAIQFTWYRSRHWALFFVILYIAAYRISLINLGGLVGLILFFGCAYTRQYSTTAWRQTVATGGVVLLGILFMTHQWPGFMNLKIVSISPASTPFSLYLKLDKIGMGILLLSMFPSKLPYTRWPALFMRCLPLMLGLMSVIYSLACWIGLIHWELTWPSYGWLWMLHNYFFTVIPEEIFFRGVVQQFLAKRLPPTVAICLIALVVTGFELNVSQVAYGLLAGLAHIGYGLSYYRYRSIEAAIWCHFILNLVHFSCFTYPAAAS